MNNVIEIQDAYIATLAKLAENHRNYYTVVTKASRKAVNALLDLGLTQSQADKALWDAHDMAKLARFVEVA